MLTNTYTYLGSEGIIISYFNVLSEQCAVTITYWKIIAKFPFSRFGFWPNFPVMQRLFLFFFADAGSFFIGMSLDFNFLPKRYLQNVTALTIVRQFFLSKLYLLILISLFKTNIKQGTNNPDLVHFHTCHYYSFIFRLYLRKKEVFATKS